MNTNKQARGFAVMDRAEQREIASQGGRAAHRSGNAHAWTPEEARAAAKKSHENRRAKRLATTGE